MAGVFFGGVNIARQQVSQASGIPASVPLGAGAVSENLLIKDGGTSLLNNTNGGQVVEFFADHDELDYIIINEPNTSISNLQVSVHFPRPVNQDVAKADALVIHTPETTTQVVWLDSQTAIYQFADVGPSAEITLRVILPKGVIKPTLVQALGGRLTSLPHTIWFGFSLALPVATMLIFGFLLWRRLVSRQSTSPKSLRDSPPEALSPGLVHVLVTGHISTRTIAATLLDLAERDFVEISSHDGTYTFTKRRKYYDEAAKAQLAPFEQALLDQLLTDEAQTSETAMQLRIGAGLFSQKVAIYYASLYDAVTARGWFAKSPAATAAKFKTAGLALFFTGLAGFIIGAIFFNDPPYPLIAWVGMMLSALLVMDVAPKMPDQTAAGASARRSWQEFRNYLSSSQAIDYTGLVQEKFFAYLPYAIAMGVEKEWAHRFVNAPFRVPDWYVTHDAPAYLQDFAENLFPFVAFLSHELVQVKTPTYS